MPCELSIIIVTWNTRELTRACLASIAQHHGDVSHEIIVVDNASGDGTVEMIRQTFPHVEIIANDTNRGFGAANNQAMQHAGGEYVLLLNSDTEITAGVLRSAVAAMRNHREVAVLGVRVEHPDGSLQLTCFAEPTLLNITLQVLGLHRLPWPAWFGRDRMRHWARDSVRDVDVVTGCFFMIRPRAMEEVGLFDEQFFFYGEETDWCRRFRAAGWAVRFMPAGTIVHHGGASAAMLDGDRGVFLADGIVRFHYKHAGALSAAIAWTLLLIGNALRMAAYAVRGVVPGQTDARETAGRFARVVRGFANAWPVRPRVQEKVWRHVEREGVSSIRRTA
jgi:hypothetical protein